MVASAVLVCLAVLGNYFHALWSVDCWSRTVYLQRWSLITFRTAY